MKKVYVIKETTDKYDKEAHKKAYEGNFNLVNIYKIDADIIDAYDNMSEKVVKESVIGNFRDYFYSKQMKDAIAELRMLVITPDKYNRVNELDNIIQEEMEKALPTNLESVEFISKED